jgi:hypothetical protein
MQGASRRALLLEEVRHIGVAVDAEEVEPNDAGSVPLLQHRTNNSTYQSSTFRLIGTMGLCRPPELLLHASSCPLCCCWFCDIISICCCQA